MIEPFAAPAGTLDSTLEHAAALLPDDPEAAARLFAEVLARDPANLTAHNAIERLQAATSFGRWMHVNCVIHPQDDIFRFFANFPASRNPIRDYLADGWRTLSELMVLLERLRQPLLDMQQVLEFAAGYGRFTRHLTRVLPGRVTCAEILPGATDFLAHEFDVATVASAHTPEQVVLPQRYDLVFVLSLFTHLPVSMWGRWLRALAQAVGPGGILLFTVHNEVAASESGVVFDDDGVCFLPSSESPSLNPQQYGTTYTRAAVVEQQVRLALGQAPTLVAPRAFWLGQDAVAMRL